MPADDADSIITIVRPVLLADAGAIAEIYAEHVRTGSASFDIAPRTVEQTQAHISNMTASGWPFLVAQCRDQITGYAYAGQFRDRPAYSFVCEDSIYIRPDQIGRGTGSLLLGALIDAAADCGFRQMLAVIGGGEPASVALHDKFGFRRAGTMRSVGRKFGKWLDSDYMQRPLGDGDNRAPHWEPNPA